MTTVAQKIHIARALFPDAPIHIALCGRALDGDALVAAKARRSYLGKMDSEEITEWRIGASAFKEQTCLPCMLAYDAHRDY